MRAILDLLEQRTPVVLVPPGVRSNMPRYDFEIRELDPWALLRSLVGASPRVDRLPLRH